MEQTNELAYDVFKTPWGWFGLLAGKNGLLRSCLPCETKEKAKKRLLLNIDRAKFSKNEFSLIKDQVHAYFKGEKVDFSRIPIDIHHFTPFQQAVLRTLKAVKHGNTVSYGQLAELSHHPKAARAIGSVMANNPLPLIIPCHRVIKSDGKIGLFSAEGGPQMKKRMLELEKNHF